MSDKNGDVEMKKKFKMPSKIKSYKIEKELYKIANGHICLGTNTNINEKVLIKIYDKEIIHYQSKELTLINNEILMMKLINHRNALKLYEIIESPSYIFLVMEYFNGVRLVDHIKRKTKLSEDEALNVYKQIISLLLYLHDMNMGHLDLNYNNILIDNSNNIRVCEFKYCLFYSSNQRAKINTTGDKYFLAPELYSKKSCHPELSDIWSSGVLLYYMTVGELPFYHQNELDLQKLIMKAEFKLPSNMNKNMQDFFKNVFEEEDSRYKFNDMLNSELFKQSKINRNNLQNGINILLVKYPIDERAMNICETQFNLSPEDIKQKLNNNIFDPYTSLYKQIIAKFNNKKIAHNGDLSSKKFNDYINNESNYIDEKTQKKNIQKNINNEIEYKNKSNAKENDINKNLQKNVLALDDLLKKYKDYIDPEKRKQRERESKSVEISKKRTQKREERKEPEKVNKDIKKKPTLKKPGTKMTNDRRVQINKGRRMTSNLNMDENLKSNLDKFKMFGLNQNKKGKKNAKKNANVNINVKKPEDIIEETNEDYLDNIDYYAARKRNQSFRTKQRVPKIIQEVANNEESPSNSKRNSVEKKERQIKFLINDKKQKDKGNNEDTAKNASSLKNKPVNKKDDNTENIDKNIESGKKSNNDAKTTDNSAAKSKQAIKPQKSKKFTKDNKNNNANFNIYAGYAPVSQFGMMNISKEEFFTQIKGVKLKKMTPNKYFDPDEIRKKDTKKKGHNPVDSRVLSVKNARQMIEEELKNKRFRGHHGGKDLKSKYYSYKPPPPKKVQTDLKYLRKQMELKYNNPAGGNNNSVNNRTRRNAPRKSVNVQSVQNNLAFKNKGLDFGNIKKVKTNKFKGKNYNNTADVILEEDGTIETPKFKKKNEKKKNKDDIRSSITEENIRKKKKEEEEERKRKEEEEAERRRKEEEEERARKEEEERERKEEEERRLRQAEIDRKRMEEEEENRRRLEEIENREKEEREKKIRMQNIKKQKEEEMRQKREKEAKERRNKNYNTNPFELFKKKTLEDSEEESSVEIKPKKSILKKKTKEGIKKKKSYRPKINDFNKFGGGDKDDDSESESYELPPKIVVKNTKNSKKDDKNALSKSVENRNKNSMFDKYTNFFFNEDELKGERLKSKKEKEKQALAEKNNVKKGFYHYQNNPTQIEKRVVDKKFEVRMRGVAALKQANTNMDEINNKKKINKENAKRIKTTSNLIEANKNNEKDPLSARVNKVRNNNANSIEKRQNNTIAYNHIGAKSEADNQNKSKSIINHNKINNEKKNKVNNKSFKKLNVEKQKKNIVQNLMEDFDETMNEYMKLDNKTLNMTSRDIKKSNYNKKDDYKKKKTKNNYDKQMNYTERNEESLNHSKTGYDDKIRKKTERNKSKKNTLKKDKQTITKNLKPKKSRNNIVEYKDSSRASKSNAKKSYDNSSMSYDEEDLPVYKGDIDYNNTSAKDIDESINDLMARYKKKGYKCVKKDNYVFKFVKGPKTHRVELMRLGNGLLYFNVTK